MWEVYFPRPTKGLKHWKNSTKVKTNKIMQLLCLMKVYYNYKPLLGTVPAQTVAGDIPDPLSMVSHLTVTRVSNCKISVWTAKGSSSGTISSSLFHSLANKISTDAAVRTSLTATFKLIKRFSMEFVLFHHAVQSITTDFPQRVTSLSIRVGELRMWATICLAFLMTVS